MAQSSAAKIAPGGIKRQLSRIMGTGSQIRETSLSDFPEARSVGQITPIRRSGPLATSKSLDSLASMNLQLISVYGLEGETSQCVHGTPGVRHFSKRSA